MTWRRVCLAVIVGTGCNARPDPTVALPADRPALEGRPAPDFRLGDHRGDPDDHHADEDRVGR